MLTHLLLPYLSHSLWVPFSGLADTIMLKPCSSWYTLLHSAYVMVGVAFKLPCTISSIMCISSIVTNRKLTFRGGQVSPVPADQASGQCSRILTGLWVQPTRNDIWQCGVHEWWSYWLMHPQAAYCCWLFHWGWTCCCFGCLSMYYFLGDFMQVLRPITIYMENQSAILMASILVTI